MNNNITRVIDSIIGKAASAADGAMLNMTEEVAQLLQVTPDIACAALAAALLDAGIKPSRAARGALACAGGSIMAASNGADVVVLGSLSSEDRALQARVAAAINTPIVRTILRMALPAEATDRHVDVLLGAAALRLAVMGVIASETQQQQTDDLPRMMAPEPRLPC